MGFSDNDIWDGQKNSVNSRRASATTVITADDPGTIPGVLSFKYRYTYVTRYKGNQATSLYDLRVISEQTTALITLISTTLISTIQSRALANKPNRCTEFKKARDKPTRESRIS